jgi:hypothetical protein
VGRVYLHTLEACSRKGVLLAVKCGACERVVYLPADRIIGRTVGRRKITGAERLGDIEHLLVCRGGQGTAGCGAKAAGIRAVYDHEIPGIPKGIPPMIFLNADERERKRLVRKARG